MLLQNQDTIENRRMRQDRMNTMSVALSQRASFLLDKFSIDLTTTNHHAINAFAIKFRQRQV